MKKIFAGFCAAVLMTAFASSVSAADWSKTTYSDEDPDTGVVISTNSKGVTWGQATKDEIAKVQIWWSDILEDPSDLSRVYSGSWKITYQGLSKFNGTKVDWLGGGAWVSVGNSKQYSLTPDKIKSNGTVVWKNKKTVTDSFTWKNKRPTGDDVIVFMDWSRVNLKGKGIKITISDFKIYDKNGKEIPQKKYKSSDTVAEAPAPSQSSQTSRSSQAVKIPDVPTPGALGFVKESPEDKSVTWSYRRNFLGSTYDSDSSKVIGEYISILGNNGFTVKKIDKNSEHLDIDDGSTADYDVYELYYDQEYVGYVGVYRRVWSKASFDRPAQAFVGILYEKPKG